jgi:plastocyanin
MTRLGDRTSPLGRRLLLVGALGIAAPLAPGASRRPAKGATGRIEGTVLLSNALTNRRPRFRIYADPGPGSRPPAPAGTEMRNVVLYVQRAPVPDGFEPGKASVPQRDEQFMPHVLPVYRGATVEFPNDDDVYHNVFSLSSARQFDLGRYPKGSSKSVTFDKSGTVQVFCHIHSDMSAVVLVLDNPYFAIPVDNGKYVIDGLPPGEYTVVGWHERIKPVTGTVHVVAGEAAKLDFNIPIPLPGEDAKP